MRTIRFLAVIALFAWSSLSFGQITRQISDDNTLIIKALAGQQNIATAQEVFKSWIDPDFQKRGIDNRGVATPKTPVRVYEMTQSGTLMQIFSGFPGTWSQKVLSQNQVNEFCKNYSNWLSEEWATLFLIKIDEGRPINVSRPQDNLVVVRVRVISGGLSVRMFRLEFDGVWDSSFPPRVVVPQI